MTTSVEGNIMYRTITRLLTANHPQAASARVNSVTVTNRAADPLSQAENFLKPYSTGMLILGGIFLGICMVVVAMKMGARSAAAKKGDGGHIREGLGMVAGVGLAGCVLGAGLIIVAVAVKIGSAASAG